MNINKIEKFLKIFLAVEHQIEANVSKYVDVDVDVDVHHHHHKGIHHSYKQSQSGRLTQNNIQGAQST